MHTNTQRLALLTFTALAAFVMIALAGCGKVGEMAGEKAAEKMMEAQINQGGGNTKVDISQGGVTAEGTDEKGKAFKMEMGSAQLAEKDVGLPFYPGATPVENTGTRIRNGDVQMVSVELRAAAAPKAVAAWYREQLKARGEGKMVMDNAREDGGLQLTIIDSQQEQNLNVEVSADGDGSRVMLMHSSGK
jgi:hypothetical protein